MVSVGYLPNIIPQVVIIKNIKKVGHKNRMDIWCSGKLKGTKELNNRRTGLRFVFDEDVDCEVRRACKEFGKWLRSKYFFPIRVPVYVKSAVRLRTRDGDIAVATFFEPDDREVEPYIRIASGDYIDLMNESGKDAALLLILLPIAHELTHYFQWVNNIKLTEIGRERQATTYARKILTEYAQTRDHP